MLSKWKVLVCMVAWILLMLVFVGSVHFYGKHKYTQGYNAAMAEVQAAAEKQQAKIDTQAEQYENQKAENLEKERVRYVEIQKIIRQPVYRNDCFDASGVQLINEAVAGR